MCVCVHREKLADIHFERYVVQSDFIEESDASTEGMDESETDEVIEIEGKNPHLPPNPITVENPAWATHMEIALKKGEERSTKSKIKSKKNLLGLKNLSKK